MAKSTSKGVKPSGKKLFCDGPNASKRVQTFSSTSDTNTEKLLELSNKEVAEKTKDLGVSATIEWNDYGSIAPFMQAMGQGFWQNEDNPARILTDTDFDNATVDIVTHHSNDDSTLDFAEWNGYLFLTSFSLNYPADGIATESYSFEGDHTRLFLNDWKDTSVYKADFSSSSTLKISGVNLASTHNPILLLVNQNIVAELSDTNESITFTNNASDTDVTATDVDGAITFTDGDRFRVVVSGSGTTFTTFASTPAGIGGLRRGMVTAKLYNPAGNAENTLRIQSISIDGDLSRDELVELGSKKAYFRKLTRPIDISISIEVNETDLEEYAKLVGSETAFDANTLREINFDDFLRDNVLEVLIYKDELIHTFANELKRIKFTSVSVSSDDDSTNVSDTVGNRTFNLQSENILISGSGTSVFL